MATKSKTSKPKAAASKTAKSRPAAKKKASAKKPTAKASTAKPKATKSKAAKPLDPNKCATPRCKGEPALTHLGKPLCQECWEKQCASDDAKPTTDTAPKPEAPKPAETKDAKPPAAKKPAAKSDKPKRVSAIDAAAQVLQKSGKAMRCTELIAAMAEQGLWTSPGGKTPHATLYSAILREISTKGDAARFTKVERGLFEFNTKAAEAK
jgi:hypothetical protein